MPTRRAMRCSGNLHNEGLRHSGMAEDLNWNAHGFCLQGSRDLLFFTPTVYTHPGSQELRVVLRCFAMFSTHSNFWRCSLFQMFCDEHRPRWIDLDRSGVDSSVGWDAVGEYSGRSDVPVGRPCVWSVKKFKVKHPALRVPPGGNQVDGLPPAAMMPLQVNFSVWRWYVISGSFSRISHKNI